MAVDELLVTESTHKLLDKWHERFIFTEWLLNDTFIIIKCVDI